MRIQTEIYAIHGWDRQKTAFFCRAEWLGLKQTKKRPNNMLDEISFEKLRCHALLAVKKMIRGNLALCRWKGACGMLFSMRCLTGMPVFCSNRLAGYVEYAVPDEKRQALGGLVIRRGMGASRWCAADSIGTVNRECVRLNCQPTSAVQLRLPDRLLACLPDGQCIGEVTDAIFRMKDLHFAAIEVSPGPVYRLFGKCAYACEYRCAEKTDRVIVPSLLTWTQLRKQLGEEEGG